MIKGNGGAVCTWESVPLAFRKSDTRTALMRLCGLHRGEPVVMMGVCLINRCSGAVVHAHELESPRIKTKRT